MLRAAAAPTAAATARAPPSRARLYGGGGGGNKGNGGPKARPTPPPRLSARARSRLHLQLPPLPAALQRLPRERVAGASLTAVAGSSLLLLVLRWHAVLRALTPPALALAAAGWVFAHESRAALEDDVLVLLHPARPRRGDDGTGAARQLPGTAALHDALLAEPEPGAAAARRRDMPPDSEAADWR